MKSNSDQGKTPAQNPLKATFGLQNNTFSNDMSPLQNQILNVMAQYKSEIYGATVTDLVHKLRGMASEEQIRYIRS
jgi:hypothetical protein